MRCFFSRRWRGRNESIRVWFWERESVAAWNLSSRSFVGLLKKIDRQPLMMMTALVFFLFTWQINRKVSPLSPFILGPCLAPSICVSLSILFPSCCSLRSGQGLAHPDGSPPKKAFSCLRLSPPCLMLFVSFRSCLSVRYQTVPW